MELHPVFIVADAERMAAWSAMDGPLAECGFCARFVRSVRDVPADASIVVIETPGAGLDLFPVDFAFGPRTVVAAGALPGFPSAMFDARGLRCAPGMAGSIDPFWYSGWFDALRRVASASSAGPVLRIDARGPATESVKVAAGLFPGACIEWRTVSPQGQGTCAAEGVIQGTSVRVSLDSGDDRGLTVTVACESGDIVATVGAESARLAARNGSMERVLFTGRSDDGRFRAARRLAASALACRPLMMPVEAAASAARSMEGLWKLCGDTSENDPRRRFTANRFNTGRSPGAPVEVKVFVESQCNLACPFCFTPSPVVSAESGSWQDTFSSIRAAGADAVILSGGEPALNPDLASIARSAADAGFKDVSLETNATMVTARLATELAAAGVKRALVSLHSADADAHALLCGVPGRLPRIMAGIRHLTKAGIRVHLNCVVTALNPDGPAGVAALAATMTPPPELVVFSFMAATGAAEGHPDLFASVTTAAASIRQAAAILDPLGVAMEIPGQCGLPPCTIPERPLLFSCLRADGGPETAACAIQGRFFAPGCAGCRAKSKCFGIWKEYADRFGTAEFAPLP